MGPSPLGLRLVEHPEQPNLLGLSIFAITDDGPWGDQPKKSKASHGRDGQGHARISIFTTVNQNARARGASINAVFDPTIDGRGAGIHAIKEGNGGGRNLLLQEACEEVVLMPPSFEHHFKYVCILGRQLTATGVLHGQAPPHGACGHHMGFPIRQAMPSTASGRRRAEVAP
jgi:hypothetical protein